MSGSPRLEEPLWAVSVALVLTLVIAWLVGTLARWLLRGRARLDTATSVVLSILGSALGIFLAWAIDPATRLRRPLVVILAVVLSVVAIAVYSAVSAHFQRPQRASAADLVAAGESDRVEFKSTARVNVRTGEKDARMEQVVVKTVSAFLNADGGTLLIGVDDAGTPLGLAADYATLKSPDADRFELWLRDLLTTALGQNSAAAVHVAVEDVAATAQPMPVCRVSCGASPRPVYLQTGKGTAPEFWVRSGNSTRQLSVDQAADYVMHRWPLGVGPSLAAQVRAAVRFSAER